MTFKALNPKNILSMAAFIIYSTECKCFTKRNSSLISFLRFSLGTHKCIWCGLYSCAIFYPSTGLSEYHKTVALISHLMWMLMEKVWRKKKRKERSTSSSPHFLFSPGQNENKNKYVEFSDCDKWCLTSQHGVFIYINK